MIENAQDARQLMWAAKNQDKILKEILENIEKLAVQKEDHMLITTSDSVVSRLLDLGFSVETVDQERTGAPRVLEVSWR